MLTPGQLVSLYRALREQRVLSVYLDGSASDPAVQQSWRLQLEHSLSDLRRWLEDSSRTEREAFERCVRLLDERLRELRDGIDSPGWAAFITADGVHDAQRLPAPAPTLAAWSTGPCIAPYVRALKEARPVVVVVADARRCAIYRYELGALERVDVVRAHHIVAHPAHMGSPAHNGFHTGTRGEAGHDAAQRSLLKGRDRMIADAVDRIRELAGSDAWILIGGIKRVVCRLADDIEAIAPGRALRSPSLDVHASEADIADAARAGASLLRDSLDAQRIEDILEAAGAHGPGAIDTDDIRHALEQSSVRDLYFTHAYLEDHAADAEQAIRSALDQDALVEEVSGRAAERLNEHGGIAAGLRFRPVALEAAPM